MSQSPEISQSSCRVSDGLPIGRCSLRSRSRLQPTGRSCAASPEGDESFVLAFPKPVGRVFRALTVLLGYLRFLRSYVMSGLDDLIGVHCEPCPSEGEVVEASVHPI